METNGSASGQGDTTLTRLSSAAYQEHLAAMQATMQLNPEDVKMHVMATLDENGELRVKIFGNAANESVSTSVEAPPEQAEEARGLLQRILDEARERLRNELTTAVATTLLAAVLEGRTASVSSDGN